MKLARMSISLYSHNLLTLLDDQRARETIDAFIPFRVDSEQI